MELFKRKSSSLRGTHVLFLKTRLFNEASMLPMAVATSWAGFVYPLGLPRDIKFSEADKKGILIWGGASSVGSVAIQIAKSLGFKVYATASSKHHVYLKSLGASDVFDYKDKKVVENIVNAVKKDGVSMNVGYDAVGSLKECMDILKALNPQGKSTLASAPPLKEDDPKVEGVEAKFVANPTDAKERDDFYEFVLLKEKLASGEFVPSPKMQIVDGLKDAQKGLDV